MGILERTDNSITFDLPGMTRFEGIFGVLASLVFGGFWIYYGLNTDGSPTVTIRILVTSLALLVSLFVVFRKNLVTSVTFSQELGQVIIKKGLVKRWFIIKSFKLRDFKVIGVKLNHYWGTPGVYFIFDNKRTRYLLFRRKYYLTTADPEIADEISKDLSVFTGLPIYGDITNYMRSPWV